MSKQLAAVEEPPVSLSKKDLESDQEVRWCPGCGDYAILATLQRLIPSLGIKREDLVFVSGIGCSSRFPYYMNSYGFHTIHGRAPAVATGIKLANPELSTWVITGDGDALSIGGNHFIHLMRRNVDLNILLFNNRIYGLTKGQYSPTSEFGKITKSTPYGSLEKPVDPVSLALAAGAGFVARASATDATGLSEVLREATEHKGTSFVEIFQNCNVFNDAAFDAFTDRKAKADNQVQLKHGQPLLFGKDNNLGVALENLSLKKIVVENSELSEAIVYDQTNPTLAAIIARMPFPEFPVPMGVFYKEARPCYEELVHEQISAATTKKGSGDLEKLLYSGDTWTVE